MKAYQCDKCKLYVKEAHPFYFSGDVFSEFFGPFYHGTIEGTSSFKVDLCSSCYNEIVQFFKTFLSNSLRNIFYRKIFCQKLAQLVRARALNRPL